MLLDTEQLQEERLLYINACCKGSIYSIIEER